MRHHGARFPESVAILLDEEVDERLTNAGCGPAVVTKLCTQNTHKNTKHEQEEQEKDTMGKYIDIGTGVVI